jgi:hypothetical protein
VKGSDAKAEQWSYLRSGTSRVVGLIPFGFLYDRKDGAEKCVRYEKTYWAYRGAKSFLLSFAQEKIFGVTAKRSDAQWELFARRSNDDASAAEKEPPLWSVKVPAGSAKALLPAGPILFVAGPGTKGDQKAGTLYSYSAEDGKKLDELRFDDAPVFDGMAAGGGRLYVSTQNGKVFCFGK